MSIRTSSSRRRVSAAAALVVLLSLGLTACQDDAPEGASGDEAPAGTAQGEQAGAEESPTADQDGEGGDTSGDTDGEEGEGETDERVQALAEHAVDPPGPREGTIEGPDLLIKSREGIGDDLIDEIQGVQGVEDSIQLTIADVGVQNRVLNVAAVDAGTYRNYTPYDSAQLQEQWDRVAGGEVALSDGFSSKQLVDRDGWLQLGNDEGAPELHLGATAAQVPQIDAVVNESWGEELGMPMGNALLVTTGKDAPQVVMKKLQKVVGEGGAVSILGPDLDAGALLTAVPTGGSVAEAVGTFRYTVLGGGRIQPDAAWEAANIRTEEIPILGSVTCHRAMLPQFRGAMIDIQAAGLADEINPGEYAGCYYPRFIAGSTQLSNHSYGIAIDLNTPGNQRGTVGEMHRGVVEIFKNWGFAWGGDWSYTDPMHFEMNRLVSAG